MAEAAGTGRWTRWAAGAAIVLLFIAILAWLTGARVISGIVESRLSALGFAEVSANAVALGWGTVTIGRLDLGETGSARDISVDLPSFMEGLRPAIRIGALSTAARLTDTGELVIPGYTPPEESTASGPLPVTSIDIETAEFTLSTPQGPFRLDGIRIRATPQGDGLAVAGTIALSSPYGEARGRAEGTADLATTDFALSVQVEDGDAMFSALTVSGINGYVAVERSGNAAPFASLDLAAPDVAIGDRPLGPLAVTGHWEQQRLTAHLTAEEDAGSSTDIRLTGDFTGTTPHVQGSGTLALRQMGLSGLMEFDGEADIDTTATPAGLQGRMRAKITALDYPGWVSDAELALAADLSGTSETLVLSFSEPVTGRASPVEELLPEALESYSGRPLDFSATFPQAARYEIPSARFTAAARLDIREQEGETTLRLNGPFTFQMEETGFLLDAPSLTATAEALRWQDAVATALAFEGAARVAGAEDWSITGTSDIEAEGATGPASYQGLSLAWSGAVQAEGDAIRLTPDQCVSMHFERLALAALAFSDISPPCLGGPVDGPMLIAQGEELRFDLTVPENTPLDIALELEEPRRLTGLWPGGRLVGVSGEQGITQLTADLAGGALRFEAEGAALNGIGGEAELLPDGALTARLTVTSVESLNRPPYWTPLNLEATVEGRIEYYAFTAILSDSLGILVGETEGRGTSESGSATITLYPVNFLSGATEIGDLSPFLAENVSDMAGSLSFDGQLAWGEALSSGGTLTLQGLAATFTSVRMEGLDAQIRFASLWPPQTEGEETLRIASLDAGVPLTNGVIAFQKEEDAPPRIGPISFDLADGSVTAEPFILDLGATGETRFTLVAKDVDLERMIEQADIEGLSGTGTLEGRLPVIVSADGLQVEDAGLEAITTGQLQYRPEVLPPFLQGNDTRATMLRQVLQNFEYNQLSLSLGGGSGEDASQRVSLSAKGNNPDFLEGHPVELNFDFEGAILSALKSAVSITGDDGLERLLRQQERQNEQ